MSAQHEIHVRMCELRTGGSGEVLRATLGSCVGVGLLWRRRRLYGLAHCLLPEAPAGTVAVDGKYVDSAVPSLLRMMRATSLRERSELEAVLAGGACMVQGPVSPRQLIGETNVRAAERVLADAGLRIVHRAVGGTAGRQLVIDGVLHDFAIHTLGRLTDGK